MVSCLIVGCGNKTGKRRRSAGKLSFFRVPRVIVYEAQFAIPAFTRGKNQLDPVDAKEQGV